MGFASTRTRAGSARRILPILMLLSGMPAVAFADGADEAEALVRLVYYEGLPYAEAAGVTAAGAERLTAMLADPGEEAHHANIVFVLGVAGHPGAYETLTRFAGAAQGEVSRATFRAMRTVPFALGHLSRSDPRALAWLAKRLESDAPPDWQCERHQGDRLAKLERRMVIAGIGLSDRPEAETLLRGAAAGPEADIAQEALATRSRMLRDGAAATFGGGTH